MKPAATWCLHKPNWPRVDQEAWENAFRGDDWLDDVGPGAHLRPKTQVKYAESYGHWLAWLSDQGLLDVQVDPTQRVHPDRLIAYAKWMQGKVAPVTARMRIEDLSAVLRLLDSLYDGGIFRKILTRMPKTPSRDKRKGLREPTELIRLGLDLMEAAEADDLALPRHNAVTFRDGLMIALCASRPLRRSNLAALKVGVHLQRVGDGYRIIIPDEETKSGAGIDMTWAPPLRSALERYLGYWRPLLLGQHPENDMLWIAGRGGGPLSAHTLACNFRRHTKKAFGSAIGPHRFRDAAATMMAIRDPENVRVAAAVLGHKSYQTTQKYYNLARQLDAVEALNEGVEQLLNDP